MYLNLTDQLQTVLDIADQIGGDPDEALALLGETENTGLVHAGRITLEDLSIKMEKNYDR